MSKKKYITWWFTLEPIYLSVDWVQQGAKLCVGLVQDWITLELAIRIHRSSEHSDISETVKNKLRTASTVLFSVLTLLFIGFTTFSIVSAHLEKNGGYAFGENLCSVAEISGKIFLS